MTTLRALPVSDLRQRVRVRNATARAASSARYTPRWPLPAEGAIVYAGIRVLSLAVTWFLLGHGKFAASHWSLRHWVLSWDGAWYLRLAEHGYGYDYHHAPLTVVHQVFYGFFPGYPAAIAALAWLPGVTFGLAAFAITIGAGLAAAGGLARLAFRLTGNRRISLITVALWATAPGSWTLSMAYTEALYCALAIWALCMLLDRRWLTAAALTVAAGLVRFDAIALVCALWFAALTAIVSSARARTGSARARTGPASWWRPAVALVVAPAGVAAYLGTVALWTHRLDGWFWAQANHWHQRFDFGRGLAHVLWRTFLGESDLANTLVCAAIIAALVLAVWTFAEPMPAMLRVYTVVAVAHVLMEGAAYFSSKPRYLLPAVLLALPAARMLATVRPRVAVPLLTLLAVATAWLGLYLTVIAQQAP